MRPGIVAGALLALLFSTSALAAEPTWKTLQPAGLVTDTAGILSAAERAFLEAELTQYQKATTNQIAVVTLATLEGATIEEAALAIGRRWGVGTTARNNGVVLLVALAERALRVEVGYGLEGAVPDAVANRLLEEVMVPKFREGKFGAGIRAGVLSLQTAISGMSDPVVAPSGAPRFPLATALFLLLWLTFIFGGFLAATRSWWLGGVLGGVLGFLLMAMTTYWLFVPALIVYGLGVDFFFSRLFPRQFRRGGLWLGGPGGVGRAGGGGFGGFGGGSFGGGGASGKW